MSGYLLERLRTAVILSIAALLDCGVSAGGPQNTSGAS